MTDKTIAAIATAQGQGGVGIVRISGERAFEIADRVFTSVSDKKATSMTGYTASFGYVSDNDDNQLEAIMLVFRAPHSYTGENVVEISCQGGVYVTKSVLRSILDNGASPAEPGEFTKRAFLNGKMDLLEAEAVMNVISAKNKNSVKAANSVLSGTLSKRLKSVKEELLTVCAHLSAWADYPEDEIPAVNEDEIKSAIESSSSLLQRMIDECDAGKVMTEGIDTVIVGKPNVGKSTLMNMLTGYERSIVTDIPGTTRDIVEDTVTLGDYILRLSDTAGIRTTTDVIEQIGVDKAKDRITTGELILAVFDGSSELTEDDKKLLEDISTCNSVAIINKTDLRQKIDDDYIRSKVTHTVYTSAVNLSGKNELINALDQIFKTGTFNPSEGILTGERQRSTACAALSALKEAEYALGSGFTLDAVTVSLEFAVEELLQLTGERASEEIVAKVFERFCVGK
ncbi:MAG: tRNA uridine-5-carboxymethylaminomethyl(34) synthesis GTPase MnmE [Clostridia bacterium]|nr:tRNA uridine-5-carboxymethylaminomethyl(34) synthesis GTPase MnmE [Clostridia bacterium]